MDKSLNLKLKGLWTAPNDYSGTPVGGLQVADDVIIDYANLGTSRRGFEYLPTLGLIPLDGYKAQQFTNLPTGNHFLTYWYAEGIATGKLLSYTTDWNTVTGGDYKPPTPLIRTRFLNQGDVIYSTSDVGIKKIFDGAVTAAGIPKGLDISLSLDGSTGFLIPNESGTATATTTNLSLTLDEISNEDIALFFIGQTLTGTGIPDDASVEDIALSQTVLITSADLEAGNITISADASAGVLAGQIVTADGIPANSRVVSVSGSGPYDVLLTEAPFRTDSAVQVSFGTDNTVLMSAAATASGTVAVTLSDGTQVAYRLLWGKRVTVNGADQVLLGSPGAFTTIVNNTGHSSNVEVEATIPDGIVEGVDFYQLFRSFQTPTKEIPPVDQMNLVGEGFPSGADILAKSVTILDQTPDSLKGAALYTGSDVEGITKANDPPPYAQDIALFKNHAIYANVRSRSQLKLTIDGVGSPDGVQVDDEIEFRDEDGNILFVLTAKSSEDATAGEFEIFSGGTPAQNIADTAESFQRVLNRFPDNTVLYAYLLSTPATLPGQLLIESRDNADLVYYVTDSDNGDAWTPNLPVSALTVAIQSETNRNGLLISKTGELEAVPPINYFPAGGGNNEVLRVIPLRDFVFILASGGVYRLLGNTVNDFTVESFDLTIRLIGRETAQALGNECWCLSNQGVVSISDGGVEIRSALQIDDIIRELLGEALESVTLTSFAVAYETDHRYILSLPDSEGDTSTVQQLCFNYVSKNWVRWTRASTAGFVNPNNDRLYLSNTSNSTVSIERKSGTFRDFVDESFEVQILSADELVIELDTVSGITRGDILEQGSQFSEIVSVDVAASTVTVADELTWEIDSATVYEAINCVFEWKPEAVGDPSEAKQFSEGQLIFRNAKFNTATLRFATDISPSFEDVPIRGVSGGSWGLFPWGRAPWGGISRSKTKRFFVPSNKQYGGNIITRLEIRSGFSTFQIEGVSIKVFDISFELGNEVA